MPPNPLAPEPSEVTDYAEMTEDDVREMARKLSPRILNELSNIAMGRVKDASPSVRVAAAKEILDRGLGKAAQFVEVSTSMSQIVSQLQQIQTVESTAEEVVEVLPAPKPGGGLF